MSRQEVFQLKGLGTRLCLFNLYVPTVVGDLSVP